MCVPQLLRAGTLGLGVLSDSAHGVGMVFTGLNNVFHFLRCWRKDGKYGRNGGLIADKWGLKADICGFSVSFCLVRGDGGRLFRGAEAGEMLPAMPRSQRQCAFDTAPSCRAYLKWNRFIIPRGISFLFHVRYISYLT